jgi:hypothetical protein
VVGGAIGHIDLAAHVRQLAVLGNRRGLIREGIAARRVRQLVAAYEGIRCEKDVRADNPGVTRRNVECRDFLVLILSGVLLVERVRHVEG